MTKPIITIHNLETGQVIEREMNAKEFAQYELDVQLSENMKSEQLAKATAKAALLERLGITAEEAALLLG
jgi:hypothetical protein